MALAELHHLIREIRHDQSGLRKARRTEREVQKNAAVILFTAHHLDGSVRDRAGRNAGPVK